MAIMNGPVLRSLVVCLEKAIKLCVGSTRIASRSRHRRLSTLHHSPWLIG